MTGAEVRKARKNHGWRQKELADKLGVSQGYVSLLEGNRRAVPPHLAGKLVTVLGLRASALPVGTPRPLRAARVATALSTLGYPGFGYLPRGARVNPAELVLGALLSKSLEPRLVEALAWVALKYSDMNWNWLVTQAKVHDVQNRLGFVAGVARRLAERSGDLSTAAELRAWESRLERSRLQKEDSFSPDTLTRAEKNWLAVHRSEEARHWNLLSNLSTETVRLGF